MKHLNFELTKLLVVKLGYDEDYPSMVWVKMPRVAPLLHRASFLDNPIPDGTETWPAVTLGDAMYWINEHANDVYIWCEIEHNGVKPFFTGYVGTPRPNFKTLEYSQEKAMEKALEYAITYLVDNK